MSEQDGTCPFCNSAIRERAYFEGEGWFAFLDAGPVLRGHSILARDPDAGCPETLTPESLKGIDLVLPRITDVLREIYGAKNVLVTSLRGAVPHVHFHLFPLRPEEETAWRQHAGWKTGHLHEYLGSHERQSGIVRLGERLEHKWTKEEQLADGVQRVMRDTARLKRAFQTLA